MLTCGPAVHPNICAALALLPQEKTAILAIVLRCNGTVGNSESVRVCGCYAWASKGPLLCGVCVYE